METQEIFKDIPWYEWLYQVSNLGNVKSLNYLRTWKEHNKSKKVNQYDLQWNFIKTWYCVMDINRKLLISNKSISSCCKWLRKTAWKYTWKYIN